MGKTLRRVVPGSRPLLNDRAATLLSGLPDVASRSFRRRGEVWLPSRAGGLTISPCFVGQRSPFQDRRDNLFRLFLCSLRFFAAISCPSVFSIQ
jgi:hypothetical protein